MLVDPRPKRFSTTVTPPSERCSARTVNRRFTIGVFSVRGKSKQISSSDAVHLFAFVFFLVLFAFAFFSSAFSIHFFVRTILRSSDRT